MSAHFYSFDSDDACRYGLDAAILLGRLREACQAPPGPDEMPTGIFWFPPSYRRVHFPFWSPRRVLHILRYLQKRRVLEPVWIKGERALWQEPCPEEAA